MAVSIKKGTALGALSLTPLIDIVFLLLIFFLVATRFADVDREMDVDLPSASEARPLIVQPKEIFINIDKDGNVYSGGEKYDLARLEAMLKQAKSDNPVNQAVILRADKRTELDAVVQVINVCNRARVTHSLTTAGE